MRLTRFILAALLCALTTAAHAQCTGVFASGYTCGNADATTGNGRAVPFISIFQRVMGATANATLVTNGSGVPSISQTLPAIVQGNITRLGAVSTITSLSGLPAPTLSSSAATKDYVDNTAAGRHYHPAAAGATTTVLPGSPTYNNGASGVGATLTATVNGALVIDGVTYNNGDAILVKNQAAPAQNGEYIVTDKGSGSSLYLLTRDTSMDAPAEMAAGESVFVQSGSTNANTTWTLSAAVATVGTSPVNFVQTGGSGNNAWGISGINIFNNNTGNVGIKTGAVAPVTSLEVVETTLNAFRGITSSQFSSDAGAASFIARKARGSLASPTIVVSGDYIGALAAAGFDGSAFQITGAVVFQAEGAITAGSVPTNLQFWTGSGGGGGTERMRITSAGVVKITNLAGSGDGCAAVSTADGSISVAIACIPPVGDPTGVVSSSAAVVTAYGYVKRVVLPPAPGSATATYKFATSATWPTGVEIIIPCGVVLKPDNAVTVTIRGRVTANHECQAFDHSAGGTVTGIREGVKPDWWLCNGSDDSVCINAADASVLEGSTNGSDGTSSTILLKCGKTYIVDSAAGVRFNPTGSNNLQVIGCGQFSSIIQGKGTRSFTRGIVTIVGDPGELWFSLRNFQIKSETVNQSAQCLTMSTTGNELHGRSVSPMEGIYITNCNVGVGWYKARQLDWKGLSVWMPTLAITGATNNGSGAIRLQMASTATLTTGQTAQVGGIIGTGALSANAKGQWTITVIDATHVDLNGSTFAGAYSSGGLFSSATGILMDQNAAGETQGDSDLYTGQIVCSPPGSVSGGIGIGIRMRSEAASGGLSGMRLHGGLIFYYCYQGIYATTNNGASNGDVWLDPGVQFDGEMGAAVIALANGSGTKQINNWQINGVYHTASGGAQPVFKFDGGSGKIADIQILNVRARGMLSGGTVGRFAELGGVLNAKVCGNEIASFGAQVTANELINLGNTDHVTVCNNTVVPDGIPGAVLYLVSATGTALDTMVVGTNAAGAVGATFNNASGGARNICSNTVNSPNC